MRPCALQSPGDRPIWLFSPALRAGLVATIALGPTFATPDEPQGAGPSANAASDRRTGQRALEPFNDWVGVWRGVGQPKRGSNKGAWTEEAEWAWDIDRDGARLKLNGKDAKQVTRGVLTYSTKDKKYRFDASLAGDESRTYLGERAEDNKLVLTSDADAKDQHRLTFLLRHADRLLLLIEMKPAGQSSFSRVAEIGYTRKGGSFASAADAGPKCIVTGGRGTISVEYNRKTYYVCCTGCRTAFLEDPEEIIAEAAEREKKPKKVK